MRRSALLPSWRFLLASRLGVQTSDSVQSDSTHRRIITFKKVSKNNFHLYLKYFIPRPETIDLSIWSHFQ